jgi:hypothetical protein
LVVENEPKVHNDYLRMSYFERWAHRLAAQVVKYGLVSQEEIDSGKAAPGSTKANPAFSLEAAGSRGEFLRATIQRFDRDSRYASACVPGTSILLVTHACHATSAARPASSSEITGSISFPDSNAHFQGEKRQHVYSVRFAATELWGEIASPRDSVHLDLWDDYLERV